MTIREAAEHYEVCLGECGLGGHWEGFIDPFGVAHFSERRFTRRALRNLLLLVARRNRLADPLYLNIKGYDWYYLYIDNVEAQRMAMEMGVRLPARLSRLDRLRCIQLAKRHHVKLSKRSAVYAWSHDA